MSLVRHFFVFMAKRETGELLADFKLIQPTEGQPVAAKELLVENWSNLLRFVSKLFTTAQFNSLNELICPIWCLITAIASKLKLLDFSVPLETNMLADIILNDLRQLQRLLSAQKKHKVKSLSFDLSEFVENSISNLEGMLASK